MLPSQGFETVIDDLKPFLALLMDDSKLFIGFVMGDSKPFLVFLIIVLNTVLS